MKYLSSHPSCVYNCAPLQQGLAPEKIKLIQITKQEPEGTIFFPLQSYPSTKQNHLAPFQFVLLDWSPDSLFLLLSCAHSSQNLSPCRHVIVTHSHNTFLFSQGSRSFPFSSWTSNTWQGNVGAARMGHRQRKQFPDRSRVPGPPFHSQMLQSQHFPPLNIQGTGLEMPALLSHPLSAGLWESWQITEVHSAHRFLLLLQTPEG